MSASIQKPPKLNYDDYAKIPQDGMRHEIIDGVHFVNAAPRVAPTSPGSWTIASVIAAAKASWKLMPRN